MLLETENLIANHFIMSHLGDLEIQLSVIQVIVAIVISGLKGKQRVTLCIRIMLHLTMASGKIGLMMQQIGKRRDSQKILTRHYMEMQPTNLLLGLKHQKHHHQRKPPL